MKLSQYDATFLVAIHKYLAKCLKARYIDQSTYHLRRELLEYDMPIDSEFLKEPNPFGYYWANYYHRMWQSWWYTSKKAYNANKVEAPIPNSYAVQRLHDLLHKDAKHQTGTASSEHSARYSRGGRHSKRKVSKRSRTARRTSRFIKNGGSAAEPQSIEDDLIAQIIYMQNQSWNRGEGAPDRERFMTQDRHIADLLLQYKTLGYNEQRLKNKFEVNLDNCKKIQRENQGEAIIQPFDRENKYQQAHWAWLVEQKKLHSEPNDYSAFKTRVESIKQTNEALTAELTKLDKEFAENTKSFTTPYTWFTRPKPSIWYYPKELYKTKKRTIEWLIAKLPKKETAPLTFTADSASSSSSAVKSDVSAAIIDELKALEMSLGPNAAASIAKARERLLARVAEADSSSSTHRYS